MAKREPVGAFNAVSSGSGTQDGLPITTRSTVQKPLHVEVCSACHFRSKHALWAGSQHDQRNVGCTSCHSVHQAKGEKLLRAADAIIQAEVEAAGLTHKLWQAFAVLLPVRSVGVMGDARTYDKVVVLRAVNSQDGMTADWAKLPDRLLRRISNRIINEVRGVNRVVYDVSSKPPSTIEWE